MIYDGEKRCERRKVVYWMRVVVKRLVLMLVLGLFLAAGGALMQGREAKAGTMEVRAVWVCFYEYSSIGLSNRTEAAFRKNAKTMYKKISDYGCTDVYFHVRAFDDAIYPSKIVGWSSYMSSNKQSPGYDPLKILVELAHEQGLKFHAWMNPYRVTYDKILDPAKKKSINRILGQVKEIINNYEVDGIHFDDYFYLGSKYDGVKAKTRRKNVNKLVKKIYSTVKKKSKKIQFGISPAGNYEYSMSIGADVDTWMSKKGYIDYIVPQIYWSDQYKLNGKMTKLFSERLALWQKKNKIDIPMYIGLGLYRAGTSKETYKPDYGWSKKSNNLATQLKKIMDGNCEGYSLFAYSDIATKATKKETKKFLNVLAWIELNKTKVTLKKGGTFKLEASWKPAVFAKSASKLEFRSMDEEVATIDKNGVITAVAEKGSVIVQAYADGKFVDCKVTIKK